MRQYFVIRLMLVATSTCTEGANEVLATVNFFLNKGPRQIGWAEHRWDVIQMTQETQYIMELTTDNGVFGSGANIYDRGQRLESGLQRDYFDLNFITYFDDAFVSPVPVPAAVWLFDSGLGCST